MEELHRRLIRIGLDALAEDYGYALAGGYAVRAHRIVSRVSDDVDLFAPFERASGHMAEATTRITAAYEAVGYRVEQAHQTSAYTRLNVTDPAIGAQSKVELVAEFLHHEPVESDLGPVLHRDDVAAGKTSALFTRAEVRDAIDVHGLLKVGYTREQLMDLAAQNDAGFDRRMFADSLARIQRYSDKQFAAYNLSAEEAAAIRAVFADWQRHLVPPNAGESARLAAANSASPAAGRLHSASGSLQTPSARPGPPQHSDDHGQRRHMH
ncbi:MAG: nucleotidyl transferase AbiEii/AbiGii toxin family protein [Streptomycetaceae bacterium]|nr:nucleotidyl transferase AbiEii/AbiGii toxin family protein [Streptomycetaceae bacterium]